MPSWEEMIAREEEIQKEHLDSEKRYIMEEMINPLINFTVVGGTVDATDLDDRPLLSNPFPVIHLVNKETGESKLIMISQDDECNEGGRIIHIS